MSECKTNAKIERIKDLFEDYECVILFKNFDYTDALVGVTMEGRAIYDYDKMVKWLMEKEGFTDELEAIEWIDYNTIRALPYAGDKAPLIMYSLEEQD